MLDGDRKIREYDEEGVKLHPGGPETFDSCSKKTQSEFERVESDKGIFELRKECTN